MPSGHELEQKARELDHLTMDAMWARLRAAEEYLHDICDAYVAWKKDRDPESNDSIAFDLEEALETACSARQEP